MKTCTKCKIDKDESEFNRKTGEYLQPYCKACQKIYRTAYYNNPINKAKHIKKSQEARKLRRHQRQEMVNKLKDVPCADCKQRFHPICMDFDHIDPNIKTDNISTIIAKAQMDYKLLEELKKVEVVCSNCHRLRTLKRGYGLKVRRGPSKP